MNSIVFFGAGASFGSNATLPFCPPLGNQLFDELEKIGGAAKDIPDDLKNIFRENFETGMREYYKRRGGDAMSFQREMAGYFAKFTPLRKNNYLKLIKELIDCDVIYSSLNYDLLFELSAKKILYNVSYSNKKTPRDLNLLKIHGSCNFWPSMNGVSHKGCTFADGRSGAILSPITVKSQSETIHLSRTEDSIAPSMALYAEGKRVSVSPYFVQNQYKMWCESVNLASNIFIIGVRVHLADKHIWDVIGSSTADIHYFGFKSDREMFDVWASSYSRNNLFFHENNFSEAVHIIPQIIK
ncbi:TPA: hypothetical protein ACOEVN_004313 [Klebsiella pneumoniae]